MLDLKTMQLIEYYTLPFTAFGMFDRLFSMRKSMGVGDRDNMGEDSCETSFPCQS